MGCTASKTVEKSHIPPPSPMVSKNQRRPSYVASQSASRLSERTSHTSLSIKDLQDGTNEQSGVTKYNATIHRDDEKSQHDHYTDYEGNQRFSSVFPHGNNFPTEDDSTICDPTSNGQRDGLLTSPHTKSEHGSSSSARNSFTWSQLDADRRSLHAMCHNPTTGGNPNKKYVVSPYQQQQQEEQPQTSNLGQQSPIIQTGEGPSHFTTPRNRLTQDNAEKENDPEVVQRDTTISPYQSNIRPKFGGHRPVSGLHQQEENADTDSNMPTPSSYHVLGGHSPLAAVGYISDYDTVSAETGLRRQQQQQQQQLQLQHYRNHQLVTFPREMTSSQGPNHQSNAFAAEPIVSYDPMRGNLRYLPHNDQQQAIRLDGHLPEDDGLGVLPVSSQAVVPTHHRMQKLAHNSSQHYDRVSGIANGTWTFGEDILQTNGDAAPVDLNASDMGSSSSTNQAQNPTDQVPQLQPHPHHVILGGGYQPREDSDSQTSSYSLYHPASTVSTDQSSFLQLYEMGKAIHERELARITRENMIQANPAIASRFLHGDMDSVNEYSVQDEYSSVTSK